MTETIEGRAPAASALEPGEKQLAVLRADRGRYWRDHALLALAGMAGAGAVLWAIGSPHVAIGASGAVAALAVRGLYLASETLRATWMLTDRRLVLPSGGAVMLLEIVTVRRLMGDVQVITRAGDKHLIRHLADGAGVVAQIEQARERRARRVRG